MSANEWQAVDEYLADLLAPSDPALSAALADASTAGLPAIDVSPLLGKLLHLLVRIGGARRVLELGTLAGYSTIWMARALPGDGSVVTLESEQRHADVARANIARAGLDEIVEVVVGPALETLPRLARDGYGPFDLIFIDADKQGYPDYLRWALELSHPGTVIVADNVVRGGGVIAPASDSTAVQGARRFLALVAAEPRLSATAIQTVGMKGYDGFALALVGEPEE